MQCFKVIFSLILAVIFLIGYPSQAVALNQNKNVIQEIGKIYQAVRSAFLGEEQISGTPTGRSVGAAGRGRCSAIAQGESDNRTEINQLSLAALIPAINQDLIKQLPQSSNPKPLTPNEPLPESYQYVWGKTVEKYPSFWFYINSIFKEFATEEDKYGKFVMLDDNKRKVVGPIFFQLPGNSEPLIAKLTLPEDVEGLKSDQMYNWFFSILCDETKPSRNPTVQGWIQREEEDSSTQGKRKTYLDYTEDAIFYDAINIIIDELKTNPQPNIQSDWDDFLEDFLKPYKFDDELIDKIKKTKIDTNELTTVTKDSLRDRGFEV